MASLGFKMQIYCILRHSVLRMLQQWKVNTIVSSPFWKGVLSPKGPKSWGRIDPLSRGSLWDYTNTHTIQPPQGPVTKGKRDCSPLTLLTGVGNGPLQNGVWPAEKTNVEVFFTHTHIHTHPLPQLWIQEPKEKGEAEWRQGQVLKQAKVLSSQHRAR